MAVSDLGMDRARGNAADRRGMRYVDQVPEAVPPGLVLVHNQVRPAAPIGRNGLPRLAPGARRPPGALQLRLGSGPARALPRDAAGLRAMPPPSYYRAWHVFLRGQPLGQVFAATEKAACLRAIQRWRVPPEERPELEVRRARGPAH